MSDTLTGPILKFQGVKEEAWHTSAIVVMEGEENPPKLRFSSKGEKQKEVSAVLMHKYGNYSVYRWEWSVPQQEDAQEIKYSLDGRNEKGYWIPPLNNERDKLRIAYGSCFGFHSQEAIKRVDPEYMLKNLHEEHQKQPYHLLLMGGDQVYADNLWSKAESLVEWAELTMEERKEAEFTEKMKAEVEDFYFNLYKKLWSQKFRIGKILGEIPSIMMWDDHDIFDGWGSFPEDQQKSPVYQGIFNIAKKYFKIFQLQLKENDEDLWRKDFISSEGFTYGFKIGEVAIIALDMRSERSLNQVLGMDTHNDLQKWMEKRLEESSCKHLLLMSSIPLVYPGLNWVENLYNFFGNELTDDFNDHWRTKNHQAERLMFIHRLLKFSRRWGCRITVLSGDVHLACMGYLESKRKLDTAENSNIINQFVSSAIVNTPPPSVVVFAMENILGRGTEEVDRDITARMIKFPGSSRRFFGARNWLSLSFDESERIWVNLFVEGEEKNPYTKVVHSIEEVK